MKRTMTLTAGLMATLLTGLAAQDVVKVDLDIPNSNTTQCTAAGYTRWAPASGASATETFGNVTVTLRTADGSNIKTNWYKGGTQNKPASNLVNDGVEPEQRGAALEMVLKGFSAGKHSVMTYNNAWEAESYDFPPFNAYVNGVLQHEAVKPSNRVAANEDATALYFEFTVASPTDETVIRFQPVEGYTADASKANGLYNGVFLNGFEIGVGNQAEQATRPVPASGDTHAAATGSAAVLSWSSAAGAVGHLVVLGTDSAAVATFDLQSATPAADPTLEFIATPQTDTVYVVRQTLTPHQPYFWRVDEVAASGDVVRGEVWTFRPRRDAFRGAEGYGRYAIGGRGGRVVYVTNLNDAGAGSFRAALTETSGPRTILFAVSGIIDLQERLMGGDPCVTVAGQTSPAKGICFATSPMGIGSDAVWRYVRVRHGAGQTGDGIGMAGANHSILDHASISWSIDEAFSSRGAQNITLQRSLVSEALNVAGHKNYPAGTAHGYAGSVGGDVASLHHNLLAHCSGRNWSMAGALDGDGYYAGRLDIFNTVVYNWGTRTTDGGAHEVNFVGNYYKMGAATEKPEELLVAQLEGTGKGSQSYYYHNNIKTRANGTVIWDGTNDTQGRVYKTSGGQVVNWTVFRTEPFFPSLAEVESAADAYKSVLSDVGCTMPVLDDHDVRVVRETLEGTYTYKGSNTGKPGLPDTEQDVGGYEDYPEVAIDLDAFDTDRDGLPNWWETLHGTNPQSAVGDFSEANADPDGDGYTALEDYLEWMARPHFEVVAGGLPTVVDVTPYLLNYKADFTLSDGSVAFENQAVGLTISPVSGQAAVKVSAAAGTAGVAFVTLTGTDAEGSQFRVPLALAAVPEAGTTSLSRVERGVLEPSAVGQKRPMAVYAPDGTRLGATRQGLNIVTYSDGTAGKVIVR